MKKTILLIASTAIATNLLAYDLKDKRMDLNDVSELVPYLYQDIEALKKRVSDLEAQLGYGIKRDTFSKFEAPRTIQYIVSSDPAFTYSVKNPDPKYAKNVLSRGDRINSFDDIKYSNGWLKINENEYIQTKYVSRSGE